MRPMSINMNTLKTGGWLLLLALAVTQTACNDDFMDRTPLDALSPQTYFKTESELSSYVTGLYSYVPSTGIYTDDQTSDNRSEEHTSELQSRENLVCRLLLEKKK